MEEIVQTSTLEACLSSNAWPTGSNTRHERCPQRVGGKQEQVVLGLINIMFTAVRTVSGPVNTVYCGPGPGVMVIFAHASAWTWPRRAASKYSPKLPLKHMLR
ncbi:hypothetical protein J6590_029656 [Homalodisca vitripennis]|nr:hypothetical protein J6590_029656 [Homalodisca vitripennis]